VAAAGDVTVVRRLRKKNKKGRRGRRGLSAVAESAIRSAEHTAFEQRAAACAEVVKKMGAPTGCIYAMAMSCPDQPPYGSDEHGGCVMRGPSNNVYACAISRSAATLESLLPSLAEETKGGFHAHHVVRFNVRGSEVKGQTAQYLVVVHDPTTTIATSKMEVWWLAADNPFDNRSDWIDVDGIGYRVIHRLDDSHFDVFIDEFGC
jgi:hypothetical protein